MQLTNVKHCQNIINIIDEYKHVMKENDYLIICNELYNIKNDNNHIYHRHDTVIINHVDVPFKLRIMLHIIILCIVILLCYIIETNLSIYIYVK